MTRSLAITACLLALCGCQSARPAPTPRAAPTEIAPTPDLSTGEHAANMAGEDADALRLRPASQPARPRPTRPRPAGTRGGYLPR